MSSKRDSWNTPQVVLDRIRELGPIYLDPCSNEDSLVEATISFTGGGLDVDWYEAAGGRLIYVNPPYGRKIGEWVSRCARFGKLCEVVALLPARVETKWFENVWSADAVCFWRGRLRFVGARWDAPFPSAVAYWGHRRYRFADAFSDVGRVVLP